MPAVVGTFGNKRLPCKPSARTLFCVWGLGFMVWGFRVLGFRVQGVPRVPGLDSD